MEDDVGKLSGEVGALDEWCFLICEYSMRLTGKTHFNPKTVFANLMDSKSRLVSKIVKEKYKNDINNFTSHMDELGILHSLNQGDELRYPNEKMLMPIFQKIQLEHNEIFESPHAEEQPEKISEDTDDKESVSDKIGDNSSTNSSEDKQENNKDISKNLAKKFNYSSSTTSLVELIEWIEKLTIEQIKEFISDRPYPFQIKTKETKGKSKLDDKQLRIIQALTFIKTKYDNKLIEDETRKKLANVILYPEAFIEVVEEPTPADEDVGTKETGEEE